MKVQVVRGEEKELNNEIICRQTASLQHSNTLPQSSGEGFFYGVFSGFPHFHMIKLHMKY